MKRIVVIVFGLCFITLTLFAQDDEENERGFRKENLFTGGAVSFGLGFSSSGNTFSIGASPVFGYSITNWLDAGVVVNYSYTSYKDYPITGYKVRISDYGGGVFTKLYPLRFLFVQAQFEHNFSHQKFIPDGSPSYTANYDANSLLLGAGYATNRSPGSGRPFFYIAILFDVLNNPNSPYTDAYGRVVPNISTGVQIPLFQGRKEERY